MLADYTASLGGTLSIGSYPDGSPTLADIKKADGSTATIAVVANGNGGKSISTLDVTQDRHPVSTFATTGPEPLWSAVPGDSLAGQAYSKPAVARVLINNQEKYQVIAATGIASDNAAAPWSEGRVVTAYDAETGYVYWQFKTACPVTSDVTVFETDDALEPGGPTINGYADRVVFADYCGYVYKLDPAKDLAGGWNGNAGLGTIEVDDLGGTKLYALFSTKDHRRRAGRGVADRRDHRGPHRRRRAGWSCSSAPAGSRPGRRPSRTRSTRCTPTTARSGRPCRAPAPAASARSSTAASWSRPTRSSSPAPPTRGSAPGPATSAARWSRASSSTPAQRRVRHRLQRRGGLGGHGIALRRPRRDLLRDPVR